MPFFLTFRIQNGKLQMFYTFQILGRESHTEFVNITSNPLSCEL